MRSPPTFRKTNASSRSKTQPNSSCSSHTWCDWKPGRPTSKARGEVTQRDLVRNCLAYAARPHRDRRGPRRRSDRHASGDEHRPRRQFDDDSRQHSARRSGPSRNNDSDDGHAACPIARCVNRSPRPSISLCRLPVFPTAHAVSPSISEITGMEGETITMQEIFLFERTGVDSSGQVIGRFRPTGIRPRFAETSEGLRDCNCPESSLRRCKQC